MLLLGNQMVKMQDGSMIKLEDLGNTGSGRIVPITDIVLGEAYVIDPTNIAGFIVSLIVRSDGEPASTFIMPSTFIDVNKITSTPLYFQYNFEEEDTYIKVSVGCSFRRENGKISIYINDIGIEDASIAYITK